MNIDDEYWQKRCEFWCAHYLALAQAAKNLIIHADRVDDYDELKHHVKKVMQLLEKDAHGSGK
jgi:hypothetical protein